MNMMTNVFEKLIDFTRTSAGGYYGPDGLFRMTPASKNLLTYTQEFDNAAWVKTGAAAYPFDPAMASYGPELVVNGDFSSGSTGWTNGSTGTGTATFTGGLATIVGTVGSNRGSFSQVIPFTNGRAYIATFNAVISSGAASAFGSATGIGGFPITNGLNIVHIPSYSTIYGGFFYTNSGGGNLTIDNISVREVIGGWNVAPDGTTTADTLIANAGTHAPQMFQNFASTATSTVYTGSYFVRAGGWRFVQIVVDNQPADFCTFDLTGSGSVQNNGAAVGAISFDSATGYYRISIAYTAGGGSRQPRIALVPSLAATRLQAATYAGTESIIIWGAQLEVGALTTYTRNHGGLFPPRFDYDPVTKAPRGLLVEEQRTNLLLRSEEFENASWVKASATITANAAVSPDGTANAGKLVEAAANAAHYALQDIGSAIPDNTTFTAAVYVKAAGRTEARLEGRRKDGLFWSANFDLAAATLVASSNVVGTPTIEPVGNGWFRISASATSSAGASTLTFVVMLRSGGALTYLGDGTSGIYLWGAQLEAGAFATSYIPTQASQVTRATDTAIIAGANFSNWYSQTEGTFVAEADSFVGVNTVNSYVVFAANDGTSQNRIRVHLYNGLWAPSMTAGGSEQLGGSISGQYTSGVPAKIAFGIKGGDVGLSVNGSNVLMDTVNTVPIVNQLALINSAIGGGALNGHIRSIRYYPTRLSNAQLQALTA